MRLKEEINRSSAEKKVNALLNSETNCRRSSLAAVLISLSFSGSFIPGSRCLWSWWYIRKTQVVILYSDQEQLKFSTGVMYNQILSFRPIHSSKSWIMFFISFYSTVYHLWHICSSSMLSYTSSLSVSKSLSSISYIFIWELIIWSTTFYPGTCHLHVLYSIIQVVVI